MTQKPRKRNLLALRSVRTWPGGSVIFPERNSGSFFDLVAKIVRQHVCVCRERDLRLIDRCVCGRRLSVSLTWASLCGVCTCLCFTSCVVSHRSLVGFLIWALSTEEPLSLCRVGVCVYVVELHLMRRVLSGHVLGRSSVTVAGFGSA